MEGQIATFNLAIGDDYRDKQGNTVKRTHWIPIVVHGNSADVARQYLQKGSKICVTGKTSTGKLARPKRQ